MTTPKETHAATAATNAAANAVMGNFQLTAQLPDGKSFVISGYLFDGESLESLNQRVDLLHDVSDRQRTRAEIPELEKKMDAANARLAEYKGFCAALVEKQQTKKSALTSQEKSQLDNMDINIKKLTDDIAEGSRAIADAKTKVGLK